MNTTAAIFPSVTHGRGFLWLRFRLQTDPYTLAVKLFCALYNTCGTVQNYSVHSGSKKVQSKHSGKKKVQSGNEGHKNVQNSNNGNKKINLPHVLWALSNPRTPQTPKPPPPAPSKSFCLLFYTGRCSFKSVVNTPFCSPSKLPHPAKNDKSSPPSLSPFESLCTLCPVKLSLIPTLKGSSFVSFICLISLYHLDWVPKIINNHWLEEGNHRKAWVWEFVWLIWPGVPCGKVHSLYHVEE